MIDSAQSLDRAVEEAMASLRGLNGSGFDSSVAGVVKQLNKVHEAIQRLEQLPESQLTWLGAALSVRFPAIDAPPAVNAIRDWIGLPDLGENDDCVIL